MLHNRIFGCQVLHVVDLHTHMLAKFQSSGGNVCQLAAVAFSENTVCWSMQVCVIFEKSPMFYNQG